VLSGIAETLTQLSFQLHDVTGQLSSHLANLEGEGERDLDVIQNRRAELNTLIRKYGPTLDDVIALLDSGSRRLLELDGDSDRITELAEEVAADHALVVRGADALHDLREAAAARLSAAVTEELSALAMPDAQLSVKVTKNDELALHGCDTVELLLRPHPGSDPRPISKSASGGELSRIMLALEVVIAGQDSVPTYVFDEVDSGVGGASAIEIGRRLARLAEKSQVIVVTHLAQVAAFANNHLRVVKDTSGEVTESSVQTLRGADREAEMARLLSGLPDSENALAHARELIQLASSR
ncbi:MAG: DNA repair protein RecN, partial [Actinomycetota bacterium]